MLRLVILTTLIVYAFAGGSYHEQMKQMVRKINEAKTTWTATMNPRFDYPGLKEEDISAQCGVPIPPHAESTVNKLPVKDAVFLEDLPEQFDARTKWPDCPSISDIRDQGSCGSSWALGAAAAMSDRYCVHFQEDVAISAEHLMSCCSFCGMGCNGGFIQQAWEYWVKEGLVTGGQYGSNRGCQPYLIPKCNHDEPGPYENCTGSQHTPKCSMTCEAGYSKSYPEDLHYGVNAYSVRGVDQIMTEIMTNGPVEGVFTIYEDFLTYRSGVYKKNSTKQICSQAVRILGWGTENGTQYWLVANSWNSSWGDKGYFKILRGSNECGIESQIVAGIPKKY